MLLSVPLGSANLLVLSAEKDRSAPSSAPPRSVEVIRSRPLSWITRRRRPINPKSHRHREFQTGANRSRPRFIFEPPLPLSLTHALRLSGFLPTHASRYDDDGLRFPVSTFRDSALPSFALVRALRALAPEPCYRRG